jgi:hypothetical protein
MALTIATIVFPTVTRNSLRDKLLADIDAGTNAVMELYSSATPGSGTLLAEIQLAATSAVASSPGLLTFTVPQSDASANAGAVTALSYQIKTQTGGTVIVEGTVSGGDIINSGQPVNLTLFTITISA